MWPTADHNTPSHSEGGAGPRTHWLYFRFFFISLHIDVGLHLLLCEFQKYAGQKSNSLQMRTGAVCAQKAVADTVRTEQGQVKSPQVSQDYHVMLRVESSSAFLLL